MKLIDADEFKHKWVDSFDTYHGWENVIAVRVGVN